MGSVLASTSPSLPLIPALILLPFVGAGIIALMPRSRADLFRPVALLTSVATGALAIYMLVTFDASDAGFQFVVDRTWIGDLGVSLKYPGRTVNSTIAQTFPYSAGLGIRALLVALSLGLFLGTMAAQKAGKALDVICVLIAIIA